MVFRLPTRVTLRPGSLASLPTFCNTHLLRRVLLVTDAGLNATPWPTQVQEALAEEGVQAVVFDGVEANPRSTTVDALADQVRATPIDGVIGLGGGSVLDAAKVVAMLARNPGSCADYEGKNRFSSGSLPFLAVPTTCGTGSEVTWVSVITAVDERRKMSIKGESMFPAAALVDADLLTTLPPHLVAQTGLDALTHALEAYTSTVANPMSDALAEKAMALLFQFLPRAVTDIAGDAEAREAVMEAATLAGIAFGNADVGGVHCLSESLGGRYDIPHGLGNALLLVPVMQYHLDARAIHEQLARLLPRIAPGSPRTTSIDDDAQRFMHHLRRLVEGLDLPGNDTLKIQADEVEAIAREAAQNNSNDSNPHPMSADDYATILRGLRNSKF